MGLSAQSSRVTPDKIEARLSDVDNVSIDAWQLRFYLIGIRVSCISYILADRSVLASYSSFRRESIFIQVVNSPENTIVPRW